MTEYVILLTGDPDRWWRRIAPPAEGQTHPRRRWAGDRWALAQVGDTVTVVPVVTAEERPS
ncbi:hypothetical protein [Demetria terragena]|uniref:hypothetical protein n=1 Tax=Demetria terragena TaxID=63959 RepID=UPI0003780DA4|nr:hypothetical protein [Demetria terragena]